MFYIPITRLENAKGIFQGFYELSRPKSFQNPDDLSQYYCSWILHPKTQSVMLEIPDGTLFIHKNANENIFDKYLSPFVASQKITFLDVTKIKLVIINNKGKNVRVVDNIPNYWKKQSKTREQLQQEGWFSTSPMGLP
ncbi:hypothetical protein BZZ01_05015 [Nostocales cyanobacterium HT-58-2]|nr:hypothetical protein BZZ01_05015 [Nostocales cyanobacterium HT-58-2]